MVVVAGPQQRKTKQGTQRRTHAKARHAPMLVGHVEQPYYINPFHTSQQKSDRARASPLPYQRRLRTHVLVKGRYRTRTRTYSAKDSVAWQHAAHAQRYRTRDHRPVPYWRGRYVGPNMESWTTLRHTRTHTRVTRTEAKMSKNGILFF